MIKYTTIRSSETITVLKQLSDVFLKLLNKFEENIVNPYLQGNYGESKRNLRKFGKNLTIPQLLKLMLKGVQVLVPLMMQLETPDPFVEGEVEEKIEQCAEVFSVLCK